MKNKEIVLYLAYLIVALSVYSRGFDNSFRTDDLAFLHHVTTNPPLSGILTPSQSFAFYRPGAVMLFYVEYALFGFEGGRYIAFNFLLHVIISLLAMRLFLICGLSRHVTILAGSLFVLGFGHYGKQVMWASTSGPLFAVVITLITIILTLRWMDDVVDAGGLRADRRAYPISILSLLMLCPLFHEISLFTPTLLAVIIWLCLREYGMRVLPRVMLVLAPTAAWLVILILLAQTHTAYQRITEVLLKTPVILLRYLGFMMLPLQPSGVAASFPKVIVAVVDSALYIQLLLGAFVLAALIVVFRKGGRTLKFLAVWLTIAVIPVCFVKIPDQWLELRYLYYASIPFCALVASMFVHVGRRKSRPWRVGTVTALIVVTLGTTLLITLLERQYDAQSRNKRNSEWLRDIKDGS